MRRAGFKGKGGMMGLTLAALILFTLPVQGFIRHLCFNPLGFARIDPLVSPDQPAEHVHHLHGGSNLGFASPTADYLLESNCTSCSITVDKSAYWAPAMYFEHENGTYSLLTTASAITIYYKFEKRANFEDRNYTVFQKGFRMLAGTNKKRTWDGPWPVSEQSNWGPNDTTQAALAEKAIGFNCLNYRGAGAEASLGHPYIRDKAFTDVHCTDGLRAEILFPSCWDGVNLDSADHKSHMAYPTLIQDGKCPDTHPVYLPVLFFETIWNTQEFVGVPGRYVMANGDPTGYGYHADFLAAWEEGVLSRIMADPTCTDHDLNHRTSDGIQEKCLAVANSIQSPAVAAQCKLTIPEVLAHEQVSGHLDALPNNVVVTGFRHDPGDQTPIPESGISTGNEYKQGDQAPPAGPDATSTSTPISAPVSTPVNSLATDLGAVSTQVGAQVTSVNVPETTPRPDDPSSLLILATSTYTESNILYVVVVAQTIVTETVTLSSGVPIVARHGHGHGLGHGLGHKHT